MAIVINGSGTVTGLAVGGLPDGTVDAGTLATNSVDSAELVDGAVDDSHIAALAASKLSGALPAISGAALTNLPGGGKILQVVSTQSSSSSGSSVSDWQTSSVAASITPSATSSKIFLTYTGQMYVQNTGGDVGYAQRFKQVITGGATTYPNELHSNSSHNYSSHYSQQTYGQFGHYTSMQGLVSPSTTSEITFTLQWYPYGVNGSGVNTLGGKSVITLLEIDGS